MVGWWLWTEMGLVYFRHQAAARLGIWLFEVPKTMWWAYGLACVIGQSKRKTAVMTAAMTLLIYTLQQAFSQQPSLTLYTCTYAEVPQMLTCLQCS